MKHQESTWFCFQLENQQYFLVIHRMGSTLVALVRLLCCLLQSLMVTFLMQKMKVISIAEMKLKPRKRPKIPPTVPGGYKLLNYQINSDLFLASSKTHWTEIFILRTRNNFSSNYTTSYIQRIRSVETHCSKPIDEIRWIWIIFW